MRRNYSRLESVEERKNTRKAVLLVLISLGIIVFLATLGIPLITKVIGFVTSFKKTDQSVSLIDKTPPAPPYFGILPDAVNKTPLNISGHVETGNTVIINLNNNEEELQTDESGDFSLDLNLEKGENILFAYAKDPAGNLSKETKSYTIIYDNEPPEIKIDSPTDGSIYYGFKQKNVQIKGTTEIDSSLTISDRFVSVSDDGTFSYSYPLNNGENNLLIKSIDKAGNEKETSLKLFFNE